MVQGIGIDLVDIRVFAQRIARTPELIDRLFAESELAGAAAPVLAGKFSAKEAFIKATGLGLHSWHDLLVLDSVAGCPYLEPSQHLAEKLAAQQIQSLHVSISHDAGMATATVIARS